MRGFRTRTSLRHMDLVALIYERGDFAVARCDDAALDGVDRFHHLSQNALTYDDRRVSDRCGWTFNRRTIECDAAATERTRVSRVRARARRRNCICNLSHARAQRA